MSTHPPTTPSSHQTHTNIYQQKVKQKLIKQIFNETKSENSLKEKQILKGRNKIPQRKTKYSKTKTKSLTSIGSTLLLVGISPPISKNIP